MAHLLQRLKPIYEVCADFMSILLQLILLDSLKHCNSCTGHAATDTQKLLDTEPRLRSFPTWELISAAMQARGQTSYKCAQSVPTHASEEAT